MFRRVRAILKQTKNQQKVYNMTKIDIYSGFLGAGKTTLIKKMIREAYAGEKIVLIENEFGEIGIDGGFLQEAGIEITEMNSGCICCSLVGDFDKALRQVIAQYAPERILIEPSGVGKLSDVVAAVSGVLNDDVTLGHLVAVADASKCKMYHKNFGEFYNNQIETAHTIILSRTDVVDEAKLDKAMELVRELNKDAVVVTTPLEQLTGAQLVQAFDRSETLEDELHKMAHEHHHHQHEHDEHCCCGHDHEHHHHEHDEHCCHEHHHEHDEHCCHEHHHEHEHHHHEHDEHCCCGHDHEHGHHHHHADEVFTSLGVETHKKYSADEIRSILTELGNEEKYGVVLRAKGYVAGADGAAWVHFDYVPGEADVREGGAMVIGRVCVIGSKLNEDAIRALLGA